MPVVTEAPGLFQDTNSTILAKQRMRNVRKNVSGYVVTGQRCSTGTACQTGVDNYLVNCKQTNLPITVKLNMSSFYRKHLLP